MIFEHDTAAGKLFDVVLIAAILASVAVVMLDSVQTVRLRYGPILLSAEWFFTVAFTIEYLTRLVSARPAIKYARSFFGLIDLFAVLPTYLSVLFPAGRYLIVVRVLRVLRVFRVLKLATYVGEAAMLTTALKQAQRKITIFVFTVLAIVIIVGSLLYLIEGPQSGFTSIPRAAYWAIVTLTTVGYGDIAPQTPIGQTLAAFVMIMGYGIIAVPTGIVTVEIANAASAARGRAATGAGLGSESSVAVERDASIGSAEMQCSQCGKRVHEVGAAFCNACGGALRS